MEQSKKINAMTQTQFMFAPEDLTLITDESHNLYDMRVEKDYDENLVLNVMKYGILQPVIVRQNNEKLEVVAGRRRVKAAIEANERLRKAGKTGKDLIMVPTTLATQSEDIDLFGVLVSENEIRENDSAVNKSRKIAKLCEMGCSHKNIALIFGTSRQNVENMLIIHELSPIVKDAIETEQITPTAALNLKGLTHCEQNAVLVTIKEAGEKLTVENVKSTIESGIFRENLDMDFDVDIDLMSDTSLEEDQDKHVVVKNKPVPKKQLEKRLTMFKENGFKNDRYLCSKSSDFQEGAAYVLQWVLGDKKEEEPFDLNADVKKVSNNKREEANEHVE